MVQPLFPIANAHHVSSEPKTPRYRVAEGAPQYANVRTGSAFHTETMLAWIGRMLAS
jgi:hypothetical protein